MSISNIGVEPVFITAAYGSKYHKFVRGLAHSFIRHNKSKLVIYTDSKSMNFPGVKIDNSISIKSIQEYKMNLPNSSVKLLVLLNAAKKYPYICWIDADMLVFTNLKTKINPGYINSISYGFGSNLRECEGSLVIPQTQYAISGLFSCSREYIYEYERISQELRNKKLKKIKLFDQSVLNHLISRNKESVRYLNVAYPSLIWNFEKFKSTNVEKNWHPLPSNKYFCRALKVNNNILLMEDKPFALLCWTATSIEKHLRSNFRFIKNPDARNHLIRLYT